jgi:hypothetical protein
MNMDGQLNGKSETISVELTLNEAMALTGVRFNQNHSLEVDAIKKIKRSLENKLIPDLQQLQ